MIPAKYFPVYFAPDMDPSWTVNPGVLIDVANMVPSKRNTLKSWKCDHTAAIYASAPIDDTADGTLLFGQIFKSSASAGRLILGTTKKLFSKASASSGYTSQKTFSADAADLSFTTFGNDIICCSKANTPQVSPVPRSQTLGGSPPKAFCCTTQKNFVILGDTNDGVNDLGDRLWWSGIGNDATWTPSASTQAGNLRLLDTPGAIKALVNIRDAVAVYKQDSVYILDYQGSPLLWTHRLISDKVGCASPNGVAVVGGIHYFLHRTGVYRFDGASVQPIGDSVNRYLFDKMVTQANYQTAQAVYDEYEGLIVWFFKSNGGAAGNRTYGLTYNVLTNTFGFITSAWTSSGDGSGLGSNYCVVKATLADIYAWDSTLGTNVTNIITAGGVSGTGVGELRKPEIGTSGYTSGWLNVTTGDIGDEVNNTRITRVKPHHLSAYAGGDSQAQNLFAYAKASAADSYDSGTQFTYDTVKRRHDGAKDGRFIKLLVPTYRYGELAGLYITAAKSGDE
jgi:hypothetical protein